MALPLITGLCLLAFWQPSQAAPASPALVKELNLVFLHGVGGSCCDLQLLSDKIAEQAVAYISDYERSNPGITIHVNTLQRCYSGNVDIDTWTSNIVSTIDQHFPDKKNLVLIGHSMGGKAALYGVARNVGNMADRTAMVVTVNSPIRGLGPYYLAGGVSISDFLRARFVTADQGAYESIASYDSAEDGKWVGANRHWLAFVSAESAPQSPQFDFTRVDPLPRDMDDGIVPVSAQYSEGADVVYYGEYEHGDFSSSDTVASAMADRILRYIFGSALDFSVFLNSGTFEHKAGWLPLTYHWEDILGGALAGRGRLSHTNESYLQWQEWEDAVGGVTPGNLRSRYEVSRVSGLPLLTVIKELRWLSPDNAEDGRVYLTTMAAPRSRLELDWSIYQHELLPDGTNRDHYELRVVASTPFASIFEASWATDARRDWRLRVWSKAQGPLRLLKGEWKVYSTETRYRKLIDEITARAAPGATPGG